MEKAKLGVLLIHGWTGSTTMMKPLVEPIEALGLPLRIPVLSGHEQLSIDAFKGVTWQQWVQDGVKALEDLLTEAEKVVIVGHSMGGMIALVLAADHPDKVDSAVTAGTPGKMSTPFAPGNRLHWLFKLIWWLVPKVNKGAKNYADPALAALDESPDVVPTYTVKQLFDFIKVQDSYLPRVKAPLLILQSRNDSAAVPESAIMLLKETGTAEDQKCILWFNQTDHGMFLDVEAEQVISSVVDFLSERLSVQDQSVS